MGLQGVLAGFQRSGFSALEAGISIGALIIAYTIFGGSLKGFLADLPRVALKGSIRATIRDL